MCYGYLADAIVAAHVAYVGFVVLGQLAIMVGYFAHWVWIRKPWIRFAHLGAIVIVALEAIFGIQCPLTTWEVQLRRLAGEEVADISFIGRCLDYVLFYNAEPWILTSSYIGFAILVIATLVAVPPRFQRDSTNHV
jgi:hypothetical protein